MLLLLIFAGGREEEREREKENRWSSRRERFSTVGKIIE